MKKLIISLLLIAPMALSAQKFGHINTQELFSQMPEVAQVKLKMDTINSQYETQLASMNEEIQKKYQDYQAQEATMADAIKQIRQQELQEMQQRIQLFYQTAEQAVGEREGYTYIFDSQAMVHIGNDAKDVTPVVKKELGIK